MEDKKYRENPYRAENFRTDEEGNIICPNNKKMVFSYRQNVRNNKYGRQEEVYVCEDCSGCPFANDCKKTSRNRTIRMNSELSSMHQEVVDNLQSIHGALLLMNRSIQAEGTFGIVKQDRSYRRINRKGIKFVLLEIYLLSIGFNLYKFHNKKLKKKKASMAA